VFAILVMFSGCAGKMSPRSTVPPDGLIYEQNVMSTLWYQASAEARALYYQAFNIARWQLDQRLAERTSGEKLAVVVDVDETVLDNSPFQAKAIEIYEGYPVGWDDWCNLAQAEPVPGAVEFLNYAVDNGVDVFYITNRKDFLMDGTWKNLKAKGFPQVETTDHLYLRADESSKEPRRQKIAETHEIVLLMGDNLNDLAEVFEGKSTADRAAAVDQLKDEFGQRFIVLPNPMYGAWEGAVYQYNWNLTNPEKAQKRKAALTSY